MSPRSSCREVIHRIVSVAFLFLLAGRAAAQVQTAPAKDSVDKSGFSLFNPVPRSAMREMDTDRPDAAEGAYTIDAGHVQIELSFAEFVYDHRNTASVTTQSWTIVPTVLRIGVLSNTEISLGFSPYAHAITTDRATDESETVEGFGDFTVGVKQNLWGNDGGDTALAVMGSIKIPTAADGLGNAKLEGEVGVALAVNLPHGFSLGLSAMVGCVRNGANDAYIGEVAHGVVLSHDVAKDLDGYVEYAGTANFSGESYRSTFGAGLLYSLTTDIRLDAGFRVGLTTSADDLALIMGVSIRF